MNVAMFTETGASLASWVSPLIGLLGVAVGATISEVFRRKQRVEQFAAQVFAKRLEIYEGLWELLQAGHTAVNAMIGEPSMTPEDRKQIVSLAIFAVVDYIDKHSLYLEDEVAVHCGAVFMGTEDIPALPEQDRLLELARYQRNWRITREVVMESSGMSRIHSAYGNINKPRFNSPIVRHFKALKAEQRKTDKAG